MKKANEMAKSIWKNIFDKLKEYNYKQGSFFKYNYRIELLIQIDVLDINKYNSFEEYININ